MKMKPLTDNAENQYFDKQDTGQSESKIANITQNETERFRFVMFFKKYGIKLVLPFVLLIAAVLTLLICFAGVRGIYVSAENGNNYYIFTANAYTSCSVVEEDEVSIEGKWRIANDKIYLLPDGTNSWEEAENFDYSNSGYSTIFIGGKQFGRVSVVGPKIAKKIKVNFDMRGGFAANGDASGKIELGSKLTAGNSPERSGYIFKGWYVSEYGFFDGEEPYDFSNRIWADMTLYSNWQCETMCAVISSLFDDFYLYPGVRLLPALDAKEEWLSATYQYRDSSSEEWYYVTDSTRMPENNIVYRRASVVINTGVTRLEDGLKNSFGLVSVIIPDTVTVIEYEAFLGCSDLRSITIPDSVTVLGGGAFYQCEALESVIIGSGITDISYYTFYGCSALTSIELPQGLISIGEFAFAGCSNIGSIAIPASVVSIGEAAFTRCGNLSGIELPEGLAVIDDCAFAGCADLASFTVPATVTAIGGGVFEGCAALTSIVISDSVTSIGQAAFSGCTALASINIPDSVKSIGNAAFRDCTALQYEIHDSNLMYLNNWLIGVVSDSIADVNMKSSTVGIGDSAFYCCDNLTRIDIPDCVVRIESYAFYHCSALTEINIPNCVMSIGNNAFYGCEALDSITIPDSVTEIGFEAFRYCNSLVSINLSDNLESIENDIFNNCVALDSITIPDSVVSIKAGAFQSCIGLSNITFGGGVADIGSSAFGGCTALKRVNIADLASWCRIDFINQTSNPLYYAGDLYINGVRAETIVIPDKVTSIGQFAFCGCKCLSSITIHGGVTSIGQSAFKDCSSLLSVALPDSVTEMGLLAFYNCVSLISVSIGNGLTHIEEKTFYNCPDLISVNIGNGVQSINYRAFAFCSSMLSITLPESITSVFEFYYCTALSSICVYAAVPPVFYSDGFKNSMLEAVYVPEASVDAYKAAPGWIQYASIIQAISE